MPAPAQPTWSDYLVGHALSEAQRSGEEVQLIWPLSTGESRQVLANGTNGMDIDRQVKTEGFTDWLAVEALL